MEQSNENFLSEERYLGRYYRSYVDTTWWYPQVVPTYLPYIYFVDRMVTYPVQSNYISEHVSKTT